MPKGPISETEYAMSLNQPFSEKDVAMNMTRKQSKIIRESKSKVTDDGEKLNSMRHQYYEFIKQYPEKIKEVDKRTIEEQIVRQRIDDSLPESLKKSSNWIKERKALGYLSDKHTFASMRRMSNHKSRKLFIFDNFARKNQEEKKTGTDEPKPELE